MRVSVREVPLKGGEFNRIILDIYHSKNQRERKATKLQVYAKPTKPIQREHNSEVRKLAEKLRAKTLLAIQEGYYGVKANHKKYTDFVDYFQTLTKNRKQTGKNYNHWYSTEKHLMGFVKESNCRPSFHQINKEWLEQFVVYLQKNVGVNTSASYFNILRHSVHEARRDKLILEDPLRYVHSPKTIEAQREYLTVEELELLAQTECKDELYKRVFLFGCLTGLRISDMIKLKWSEVRENEALGWHIVYTQKKTQKNETLQINEQARSFLGKAGKPDELVFKGLKYSDTNNRMLKHWALDAGIRKNVTFHIARHTYATLQLANGTDIYVLSKLLGHSKVSTTQIYGKVIDATKRKAVDNLPKLNVSFDV